MLCYKYERHHYYHDYDYDHDHYYYQYYFLFNKSTFTKLIFDKPSPTNKRDLHEPDCNP